MEMTGAKTLAVFMIIFGCFAVLYPKIFHPMILHMLGFSQPAASPADEMMNRIPPHLKRGPRSGGGLNDDISRHMRPGPHPGLRAAAEMKKTASQQGGGGGRGMMSVILPMYAVGIVLYLVYTLSKVFGKKDQKQDDPWSAPFHDVRYDAEKKKLIPKRAMTIQEEVDDDDDDDDDDDEEDPDGSKEFKQAAFEFKKGKVRNKELEKMLLKADDPEMTEGDMKSLKLRLLETEAQMTRILQAMELMQDKIQDDEEEEEPKPRRRKKKTKLVDASPSPDMDSYEIVPGQDKDAYEASGSERGGFVENVGPQGDKSHKARGRKKKSQNLKKSKAVKKEKEYELDSMSKENDSSDKLDESMSEKVVYDQEYNDNGGVVEYPNMHKDGTDLKQADLKESKLKEVIDAPIPKIEINEDQMEDEVIGKDGEESQSGDEHPDLRKRVTKKEMSV